MVPLKPLSFEQQGYDNSEYRQGNHLLHHLELHQREWAAVFNEAYPVGGNLCAIFEKRDSPREQDDEQERPA